MSHLIQHHFTEPHKSIDEKYLRPDDSPVSFYEGIKNEIDQTKALIQDPESGRTFRRGLWGLGKALFTIGTLFGVAYCSIKNNNAPAVPIVGVNMPKGYHIEDVRLPTRGDVDTVWFLPNEKYAITKTETGTKVYDGEFKYHIKPSIWFVPNSETHTDADGNYLSSTYFYDTRPGQVEVHKNTATNTIDDKVKK